MGHEELSIELLYDFAYLDRERIGFYFAQLFEDGVLTQTKRTAKDSSSETTRMGGSVKVVSGDHTGSDSVERGLERVFDPSWLAPIEVLNRLDEFNFVHRNYLQTPIGGLFLAPCAMSIIDIRMLKEMWPSISEMVLHNEIAALDLNPKLKQKAVAEGKKNYDTIAKILKYVPHAIQATFAVEDDLLWSTLRSESMLINPDDLALKHGAKIPGEWFVLGIMDAQPGEAGDESNAHATALDQGMTQMLSAFRGIMGRPSSAYGVTPIAIFRAIQPSS